MKIMVLENINGNISENDIDNVNNGRNNNGIITSSNLNDESNKGRYPKRNRKPPVHLNDYDLNNEEDVVNFVDFYLLNITVSYDTMKSDNSLKQNFAIDDKMKSGKSNGT